MDSRSFITYSLVGGIVFVTFHGPRDDEGLEEPPQPVRRALDVTGGYLGHIPANTNSTSFR